MSVCTGRHTPLRLRRHDFFFPMAPISIGKGAFVGSGSVITDDIPDDALGLGRGRQIVKEGWALEFREKAQAAKKK